jgi:pimeloyl-ACP methyl ester carboxylesterase
MTVWHSWILSETAWRGFTSRLLAGCVLGCIGVQAEAGRSYGSLDFEPCTLTSPGLPFTVAAQCTGVDVPENHGRPAGRHVDLALAWVPASARKPAPDPVFMLAGGPGQSARESFAAVSPAFREVLRRRHVMLLDQRGSGPGNPLDCEVPEDGGASAAAAAARPEEARRLAARCLAQLDADPRFYTTSDAVLDLEATRARLGAATIDLVGISYGTRLALEYLRRYPSRVRTIVLDGVVPPELALGAEHARNLEQSLDAQLERCAADEACSSRFGAPRSALARLLEELRREPRAVKYEDPLTAEPREGLLTVDLVAGVVRLYAYAPQLAAMLPMTIARAAAGQPELLMAQARMIDDLIGEQLSLGLQLSVSCAEDAPLLVANPADDETLLGSSFVAAIKAACEVWPRGRMPADFHAPVTSDRPALLLSGEFDPVTPPRYGEQVLRGLSAARHLVARGQGHNVMTVGCLPRLMADFIQAADARSLDAGCLESLIETPPFAGAYGWEP